MQGFTEAPFRHFHAGVYGAADCYFSPFLRVDHGAVRGRDLRTFMQTADALQPFVTAPLASRVTFGKQRRPGKKATSGHHAVQPRIPRGYLTDRAVGIDNGGQRLSFSEGKSLIRSAERAS